MKRAVFLFETTGYAAKPFTDRGWETFIVDTKNVGSRAINPNATHVLAWDILAEEKTLCEIAASAALIFGFPPCTDLAVSGAKHFARKRAVNPAFQAEAKHLALSVERIGTTAGKPWAFENPVSVLSTIYRPPNFVFHPYEFGGYLAADDAHPDWPQYIEARDAYSKKTCLWCGNGFRFPKKYPVPVKPGWNKQTLLLGGKSERTKIIRSASPRGFFTALAELYTQEPAQ